MGHRDGIDHIPDRVAGALRAVASGAPDHAGDLAAVRARGLARRRHRVAAAGVTVAAAAAMVLPTTIAGGDHRDGPGVPPAPPATGHTATATATAELSPPAQRLIIDHRSIVGYPWPEDYTHGRAVGEVLPTGEVVSRELPEVDAVLDPPVPLPDGRLVVRAAVELSGDDQPERRSTAGRCWQENVAMRLYLLAADGSVERMHDIAPPRMMTGTGAVPGCEAVRLVGADEGAAYLLRDSQLVAHDLGTGIEEPVVDVQEVFGPLPKPELGSGLLVPSWPVAYDSGWLVTVGRVESVLRCPEHTVEVASPGGARASHPLPGACIGPVKSLRLSPAGRYVAVGFGHQTDAVRETRVAVLDLAGGDWPVRADRPGFIRGALPGLAWRDENTLQVAWPRGNENAVAGESVPVEVETLRVP